ncbi:hypothetical protein OSTOST_10579 [Ostertagia ostertagi]
MNDSVTLGVTPIRTSMDMKLRHYILYNVGLLKMSSRSRKLRSSELVVDWPLRCRCLFSRVGVVYGWRSECYQDVSALNRSAFKRTSKSTAIGNFDMEICRKETGPMCMEIEAVGGKSGRATITWLPPPRVPLFYHDRYMVQHRSSNSPLMIWQIATKRDIKADGTVTSLALDVAEDQVYGVQVCAIYSQLHKRPKFGLVRVTPFHCTSCNNTGKCFGVNG